MKGVITNHSCGRITRMYAGPGFELDIPGEKTITVDIPDEHVDNVRQYLREHHPAVVFQTEAPEPEEKPELPSLVRAQMEAEGRAAIYFASKVAPANGAATTVATTVPKPATPAAATPPQSVTKKGAGNLKPARKKA